MFKKLLVLTILPSIIFLKTYGQDFLGLNTGNYSGITGVMLQPASIVDSRFKFDLNLFSTGMNYNNNYFLLDKDVILKFNKRSFDKFSTFKNRYLSEASLSPGEKVFFQVNQRSQLPLSFMATTGKKSAVAVNLQFRSMIQGTGITQDFAHFAFDNFYTPDFSSSVDASGLNLKSLSWAEVGLTYGRVLYSSPKHFLKAAVTGKYLGGLSSINLSSNDLQMEVNSDSSFNITSSYVSYKHNKNADFSKIFEKSFRPNASSIGLDAGLVYEFRGNLKNVDYISNKDEVSFDASRRDVNKYIFRLGLSLLDVGMFQFKQPQGVNSFIANIKNWDIRNAHYKTLKEFDTALAARVFPDPNETPEYNVHLPTALSAQLDVKFVKGVFLNLMTYWPVNLSEKAGKHFDNYGYFTITPRLESRHFGIYIPYTVLQSGKFTNYKNNLLGATLRAGPVFVGSSNLGSMLFNKKLKAADVHVGLKIGITYGKANKTNKLLKTIFRQDETAEILPGPTNTADSLQNAGRQSSEAISGVDTPRILLNYKDGKIYDNPNVKQNITIINNYYYGNALPTEATDTVILENLPNYNDSINRQRDSLLQKNKEIADSISKVTEDSLKIKRRQLDSLIRSMQQLQLDMDSLNRVDSNINNNTSLRRSMNKETYQDTLFDKEESFRRTQALLKKLAAIRSDADSMITGNESYQEEGLKKKRSRQRI